MMKANNKQPASLGWIKLKYDKIVISYTGTSECVSVIRTALENSSIQATQIASLLSQIPGFYGVIGHTDQTIVAAVDHIRSFPIFYRTKTATGSPSVHPDPYTLVGKTPNYILDRDRLREFAMAGYVSGQDTLVPNLYQLEAGEVRVWNRSTQHGCRAFSYQHRPVKMHAESVETLVKKLGSIVDTVFRRTIAHADGKPIFVPLSGGQDSRLVLAKLAELQYPNLFAFSYGPRHNSDASIAKDVARQLNVPWFFVPTRSGAPGNSVDQEMLHSYWRSSDGLCAIPNHQDLRAVSILKQQNLLPNNAMIVNGQTGDFITGGHIPHQLLSETPITVDQLLGCIVHKHYGLWQNLLTPANLDLIRSRIFAGLALSSNSNRLSRSEAIAHYEHWEYKERQAKYVVQGQRIYDYYNLDWDLPLWDRDFISFWRDVPYSAKYQQLLYKRWLREWDYAGIFSNISTHATAWPRTLSKILAPVAIFIRCVIGRTHRDRLFKYLNYFDRFGDHYSLFGFPHFVKHVNNFRNPASFYVEAWLSHNNINLDDLALH